MKTVSLALLILLTACASIDRKNDPLAARVSDLVDETMGATEQQQAAFHELEALGEPAVPYLIGHLGDMRELRNKHISLVNLSSNSFEGIRHYGPKTVHDALSAILNQITATSFNFVYNGADAQARAENRLLWVAWCKERYPAKSDECSGL